MLGHYGMMSSMGIAMCILMFVLGLTTLGGVVYFAVKLALQNTNKIN